MKKPYLLSLSPQFSEEEVQTQAQSITPPSHSHTHRPHCTHVLLPLPVASKESLHTQKTLKNPRNVMCSFFAERSGPASAVIRGSDAPPIACFMCCEICAASMFHSEYYVSKPTASQKHVLIKYNHTTLPAVSTCAASPCALRLTPCVALAP